MGSWIDRQMAERRERILEAARRVIEQDGYEGLTMRRLAAESRVTAPTLYNLVGNKEEVLLAAVEEQTQAFVAAVEDSAPDLVALVDAVVRRLVKRPRYYRALLEVLLGSGSADAARRYVDRALDQQIRVALAELEGRGELADWVEPRALARQIHSHLDVSSLSWARGAFGAAAFRATARFGVAMLLLGVTSGESRERFEALARESQAQAGGRRHRGRAA